MVQSKPVSQAAMVMCERASQAEEAGRGTSPEAGVAIEDSDAEGIDISDHHFPRFR